MTGKCSRRQFITTCSGFAPVWLLAVRSVRSEEQQNVPVLNPLRRTESDLRPFMRLGIEHIYNGAVDRRFNCMPFVRFNLTDPPTWARHIEWGCPHMVGRFVDALAMCAEVFDFEADPVADRAFRKYLHDCLDNEYTMPFHITIRPAPGGARSGWIHNCREVLLGLLGLAEWKGDDGSLELAKRFVRAIDTATRENGRFPSGSISSEGWGSYSPDQLNMCSGRLIRALLRYYRVTGDELGVELAKRFADTNIRETFTPDGYLKKASGNHLHSTQGTMTGIIDLGILTNNNFYLETGCRLYDHGLAPWRTSWGWAKEYKTYDDRSNWHYRSGEANNTGDYIESALLLGQSVYKGYDDAERFIRNGLLAAQVHDTGWIAQSDEPDTEETVYSDMRNRAKGAFVFTIPNGYLHYHTDLMGGALQSLAEAYHATIVEENDTTRVNMFFTADSPSVAVESFLPVRGEVRISIKRPTRLHIRIPDWVGMFQLLRNGRTEHSIVMEPDGMLFAGLCQPQDTFTLTFDLEERESIEYAPGFEEPYTVRWKGNTITGMSPAPANRIALY